MKEQIQLSTEGGWERGRGEEREGRWKEKIRKN